MHGPDTRTKNQCFPTQNDQPRNLRRKPLHVIQHMVEISNKVSGLLPGDWGSPENRLGRVASHGTAKAWDLHRYDTMGEADTWFNYSSAIRAEYMDTREAANAQIKLGQLKYTGDIQAYFTELRALNRYAQATGEGLQEKVNIAMTSEILRMRFAHYKGGFVDDNDFMEATYQAGLQVEEMKALEKTREAARVPGQGPKNNRPDEKKKEDHRKKEEGRSAAKERDSRREDRRAPAEKKGWESRGAALKGVPQNEIDNHKKVRDGCWRWGRTGPRTSDCFSFQTT